jgi:hypothetical protein
MIKPNSQKIATNSVLTEEERRALIAEIRYSAEKHLNARMYLPVRKVGADKFSVRYWSGEHMGQSKWAIGDIPEFTPDVVEVTPNTLSLIGFGKGFNVSEALDNTEYIRRNARSAALQVLEDENQYISTGLKNIAGSYVTTDAGKGMLARANNSVTSAYDFGVAGSAITAVAAGLALLRADNIVGPYFLALNTTQYGELESSIHTGGVDEMQFVNNMLSGGRSPQRSDRIFLNPDMTAGSGMIWARRPEYAELVVGADLTEKSIEHIDGKSFKIYQTEGVIVYETNSICLLNKI